MKKLFLILLLCCFTLNNAYSFFPLIFKFDVMGGETVDVVGKVGENAENVENTVKDTSLITQIGEGFKEATKWVKEQVKKAKDFAEKAKEYKEAYDTVKKELYDNKLMQIKTLNDDISNIKKRYDNINTEISNIKNNIESAISADKELLDGKINTLELNRNAYLKAAEQTTDEEEKASYLQQAEEMVAEQEALKKQQESLNKEAVESVKNATKTLDKERKQVEKDLKKLYADLALLLNMTSGEDNVDPAKAMQYTIDMYFLNYEAKETPDAMEEKRYNRLVERRNAIINAYEAAAKVIPDMQAYIEESEDMGYSASTFDTIGGAVGAMAEMKVKNLQALKLYADLLVADIKMRTAIGVAGLNFYKMQKPDKDLQVFNLDDYIYQEEDGKKKK